jgi:hypothetical protein
MSSSGGPSPTTKSDDHLCTKGCCYLAFPTFPAGAVLQERLELQRRAEAEFARERSLVDEVVARIQAEDRMELQARRCKQAETKVRRYSWGCCLVGVLLDRTDLRHLTGMLNHAKIGMHAAG